MTAFVSLDIVRVNVEKGEEASAQEREDARWRRGRSAVVTVEWEARHLDLLDDESDGYVRLDRFTTLASPPVSVAVSRVSGFVGFTCCVQDTRQGTNCWRACDT